MDDVDYFVSELQPENVESLQKLFDQCADYAMIVEGEEVSPSAAQETFESAPPGRSLSDKFVYGLLDRKGDIVGVLEGMRHYPDEMTWWIGLFMLAPEVRGRGLGQRLIQDFSAHVRSEQGASIMLGVVEENDAAHHFWRKLGFELVRKTEPRLFGKKTQAVYVMRRSLP
jgi:ribosomal protein S18 acetylase RimI-like enzyme